MTIFDHKLPSNKPYRLIWPLCLMLLFLSLGWSVQHTHFWDAYNQATLAFFIDYHHTFANIFFTSSTLLGEPPYYYAFGGALLIWLLWFRYWLAIYHFSIMITMVFYLSPFFKHVFQVRRPSADIVEIGYAFPSGHTFLACVFFGFLSLIMTQHLKTKQRYIILLAYNVPALLVALSRLYLGVHWLTDILGSALIAWAINLTSFFIYTHYATYTIKPNRCFYQLCGIAAIVFFYLIIQHIEKKLAFYQTIFGGLQ